MQAKPAKTWFNIIPIRRNARREQRKEPLPRSCRRGRAAHLIYFAKTFIYLKGIHMQTKQTQTFALISATLFAAIFTTAARADWIEDFDSYPIDTIATNLPRWSVEPYNKNDWNSPVDAFITNNIAYSGNSLWVRRALATGTTWAEYEMTESEMVMAKRNPASIQFKIYFTGDIYSGFRLFFYDSGSMGANSNANGFMVEMDGGNETDPTGWDNGSNRDNSIRFSFGGDSVWSFSSTTNFTAFTDRGQYANASRWLAGKWYTISLTNILLSASGEGTNSTAVANMWESDLGGSTWQIKEQPIIADGIGCGAFKKIDRVRFQLIRTNSQTVYIDDIEILDTPPKKTTLIMVR